MRRLTIWTMAAVLVGAGVALVALASGGGTYDVTATAIEACSCPLFCSCYYNAEPTGGHMCQFNNAYKFEDGSHWGDVDLSGAKIWVSGDLGSHFADGTTEWATVTFDKATTPEQRQAIQGWMGKVFPVQWGKVEIREDDITWTDSEKTADAALGSGLAKIHLDKVFDPHGEQSVVSNTAYWGANSNTGFRLAHSTHEHNGEPSYSFEGRNGFTITLTAKGELPPAAEEAGEAEPADETGER
jgi:hypothetical protein